MNVALILSGGTGTRLGLDIPKQYIEICGKPIIFFPSLLEYTVSFIGSTGTAPSCPAAASRQSVICRSESRGLAAS